LIDSLCIQIRLDVGYSKSFIQSYPDIPFSDHVTDNIDAFNYYCSAFDYKAGTIQFYNNLLNAIGLDSAFAEAMYHYIYNAHYFQMSTRNLKKFTLQLMRHRNKLRPLREVDVRILYYRIFDQIDKAITLAENRYELDRPKRLDVLLELANLYHTHCLLEKLEETWIKIVNISKDPSHKIKLAQAYLYNGRLRDGRKLLEQVTLEYPEDTDALIYAGIFALRDGDYEMARKYFESAIMCQPEKEELWSKMFNVIRFTQEQSMTTEQLEKYTGVFRSEEGIMESEKFICQNYLFSKATNQTCNPLYFSSDTTAHNMWFDIDQTFVMDDQGEIIKIRYEYEPSGRQSTWWKQDSLIQWALKLSEQGKNEEVIQAFRDAYRHNPDHYYLADYIQHLEFAHNMDYGSFKDNIVGFCGTYDSNRVIDLIDGDLAYVLPSIGREWKLLPLSESEFMIPSSFSWKIRFTQTGSQITGFYFIRKDRNPIFYKKD
jgi:tetratricopeptide (TPR) repeat protein